MSPKKVLHHLTGHYSDFSLEYRIFHCFCIVAIISLASCIPLNFALDLPISALLSLAGMIIQSCLFYLSRFRKKSRLSLVFSLTIIHLILVLNYYYNAGINGPTLLLLLTIFFLVTAISDPKSYKYWLSLNATVVLGLLLYEYFNPHVIELAYVSRLARFGDIITTYCLCALIILIGLHYIKRNYYKSQELLKAKADDLEKINQTKNKMFSIVSHDLRAPIASIQSYLEILSEMDIDHQDNERLRSDLVRLTQNTDMMLSNLLMWSKSQMDGIVMNKTLINLSETIMPVVTVFKQVAERKGVALIYDIDPTIQVIADKNMLQLVIRNILSNAIKFTHEGSSVNVSADCENSRCEIIIKDSGVGMDEQTQATIFSNRAEPAYGTNNEKGVGLGLSLSKEFTELQGGQIRFKSEANVGTTFYITMPLS
jgi:two-component system sensor histidine kinase/response regulator